jgi:hypothetical protein
MRIRFFRVDSNVIGSGLGFQSSKPVKRFLSSDGRLRKFRCFNKNIRHNILNDTVPKSAFKQKDDRVIDIVYNEDLFFFSNKKGKRTTAISGSTKRNIMKFLAEVVRPNA